MQEDVSIITYFISVEEMIGKVTSNGENYFSINVLAILYTSLLFMCISHTFKRYVNKADSTTDLQQQMYIFTSSIVYNNENISLAHLLQTFVMSTSDVIHKFLVKWGSFLDHR